MSAPINILVPLVDGFEEIEAITPVDLLRRAGARVVLASVTGASPVSSRGGVTVMTDTTLDAVAGETFDLLFLPGGPGVKALRAEPRVLALIRSFSDRKAPVAAICAAPTLLKDAGILEGRAFAAHYSVLDELPGASPDAVVVDRKTGASTLLTARSAGPALIFGLALIRHLYGEEKEREISAQIMA